jgi:hypothetical protein
MKVGSRLSSIPARRLVLAKLGLSHGASHLHKLLEKVLPHLQKISEQKRDFKKHGLE